MADLQLFTWKFGKCGPKKIGIICGGKYPTTGGAGFDARKVTTVPITIEAVSFLLCFGRTSQ